MKLYVNNEVFTLSGENNLDGLLKKLEIKNTTGMAVAVNGKVIRRNLWEDHSLNENDKVLIIKASQGG